MLKFLKDWTLPVAMLLGVSGYFMFANFTFLEPAKPFVNTIVTSIPPFLIFAQLLLAFCKVDWRELLPSPWQGWLLLFQLGATSSLAALLICVPMGDGYRVVFEAAMVCLICPTATAAAIITGKLGGSVSGITTYTLLSNLLTAIVVPLLFPLVEPHTDVSFVAAFFKIVSKVFPLLLFPFFVALFFRYMLPKVHLFLLRFHGVAFYLWAVALVIVTGQTVRSLMTSTVAPEIQLFIVLAGFITCVLQFFLGKRIGSLYQDRISAGQALGQKNTILAIWMAYTYLDPVSSAGPGSYVLWQNIFNSWQLWKKRKKT